MKTKEELSALKEEFGAVSKKLAELTEEELAEVVGGNGATFAIIGETAFLKGNRMMPYIAAVDERDEQMINDVKPSSKTLE